VEGSQGIERRIERAVFETDRYRIVGDVTLPPEGYKSRFSDSLNRGDLAFVSLSNVQITPLDGGPVERKPFIVLSRTHVRIAYPFEEGA
jgi:hypothetical protein